MFIQSHLLFQLSGNTQLFLNFYVKKFVKTENCWDSLPEGHVLVEFHINLRMCSAQDVFTAKTVIVNFLFIKSLALRDFAIFVILTSS